MPLKLYPEEDVQNIANAIRSRNGTSNLYKIGDMASEIENLNTVGNKKLVENLIHGTVVNLNDPYVTKIGSDIFVGCETLETIDLPACTTITYGYAFRNCRSLTTVNLPACTTITGTSVFMGCYALATVNLPACSSIALKTFYSCSALATISLPACTYIGASVFYNCVQLSEIYLCGSTVCNLANTSVFNGSPIKSMTGTIYVPSSLYSTYISATNWVYFSSIFASI